MAQREFERCVANPPAAGPRGDSAGRLHAIGRSSWPVPGSGDGTRVPAGSPPRIAAALLHLQRWYGNRFVQQVVRGGASAPIIQTKMMVGPAGDCHEREADRVAGLVRSGRATRVPHGTGRASGVLRRAGADGGPAGAGVQQAIRAAHGGGQSLPDGLRSFMEQVLGADFTSVRVHTDTRADQLNRVLQARAFTTGQDLFFRRGEYDPSNMGGREVLAHELTHVTQQMGAAVNPDGSSGVPPGGGAGVIQRMRIGNRDTDNSEDLKALKARALTLKTVGDVAAMRAEITSQLGDSQPDANVEQLLRILEGMGRLAAKKEAASLQLAGHTNQSAQLVPPPGSTAAGPPGNTTAPPTATTEPPTPEPPAHEPPTPENTTTTPEPPTPTTLELSTTLAESDDSFAFVAADYSVPVVVKVYVGQKADYDLRKPAEQKMFIERITATNESRHLISYKRNFTTAVSDVPDPDSEFPDVIKAFAATTLKFPELAPRAAEDQIKNYANLSQWSKKGLPLFGSTQTTRVELASVPDLEASKKDHKSRDYELTVTFGQNAKSDQAAAVATYVANALHEVRVHGASLRQVVKVRDTNELYFLNIRIPRLEESAAPPAQIDVTVDAVKADRATARYRIDLSKLSKSLSDRILKKDEVLYYKREVGGNRQKLDLKIIDWRSNEIALLRRAIDLIPPAHQSMLSELKFVRVHGIPGSGDAAAQYFQTDPPVICVSDKVMDPEYDEYVHDAKTGEVLPKSVRLIVHEIGHAVSIERWRKFTLTYDEKKPESVNKLERLGGPKAISAKPIADLKDYIKRGEYVTDYAAWEIAGNKKKTARSELFAEAYSLWLTDPDYMNRHHKVLAKWFTDQEF